MYSRLPSAFHQSAIAKSKQTALAYHQSAIAKSKQKHLHISCMLCIMHLTVLQLQPLVSNCQAFLYARHPPCQGTRRQLSILRTAASLSCSFASCNTHVSKPLCSCYLICFELTALLLLAHQCNNNAHHPNMILTGRSMIGRFCCLHMSLTGHQWPLPWYTPPQHRPYVMPTVARCDRPC